MAILTTEDTRLEIGNLDADDFCVIQIDLKKELLHPAVLHATFRRKKILHDSESAQFGISKDFMGQHATLYIETSRTDENGQACGESLEFDGIITAAQSERISMGSTAVISITAYSPDYLLFDNPHCQSFENMTLQDIVEMSIQDYSDIIHTEISPFWNAVIPYTVQYNESTYQFISRLARRYGEFMYHEDGAFVFGRLSSSSKIKLYPQTDIVSYRYNIDLKHGNKQITSHDYLSYTNPSSASMDEGGGESGMSFVQSALRTVSDFVFGQNTSPLTETAIESSGELYSKTTIEDYSPDTYIDKTAEILESTASVDKNIRHSRMVTCHLNTNRADIQIGNIIIIQERDEEVDCITQDDTDETKDVLLKHAPLVVISIMHRITNDGHYENEIVAIPAADSDGNCRPPYIQEYLYPRSGCQRAKVIDNKDPEALGRIRVQFLWQEQQDNRMITPWIRIAQPHGGDDKGCYFIPEIGEEVMVDFVNGNVEKPYVTGTLYHGSQRPGSKWYSPSNNIKAIRTRNGHTIEINDIDPGGFIRIYDYQKENYILTYSTDEKLIRLESTGNIELIAHNNIVMHADNDIIMTADHNMNITVKQNRTADIIENDTETIGKEQTIHVGEKQETTIGTSQHIQVAQNQETEITGSQYTDIKEDCRITAKNLSATINENMQLFSKSHEQKADEKMSLDGGSEVNIFAKNVKIN